MERYVIRHRHTGWYWIRLDRWTPDPRQASQFDFADDADQTALIECLEPVSEWQVEPSPVNVEVSA